MLLFNKIFPKTNTKYYRYFKNDIPVEFLGTQTKKTFVQNRILFINLILCIVFFILVFSLLLKISIFPKNSDKKQIKNDNLITRPNIVDRNGEIIATNIPTVNLYIDATQTVNAEQSSKKIVNLFKDLKYDDVLKKLNSNKKFIYIKRDISPFEKDLINQIGEPAFNFETSNSRYYPNQNLFSHIIGITNIDNKGISGIEKYIDNKELNNLQQIILSIDTFIQETIRNNLISAMKKYNAKTAGGIMMNVKTGEILGFVSLPDFNYTNYSDTIFDSKYNNHISYDIYEPGSVMKIFTAALAIENNFNTSQNFDVLKPFKIGNHKVTDSHFEKQFLNMQEGFIYSSNIVMAKIASIIGTEKQQEFLNKVKIFDNIKFELPEMGKTLKSTKWDDFITASIGYGYSISPTILHLVSSINGIINDGIYVFPTILKRNENSILKTKQIVSFDTSQKIKNLLQDVVKNGTGKLVDMKDIDIGGKTGTSYKIINKKYDNGKTISFFVSIFPIASPKYIMLIMLDEAKNGFCKTASCTAVPTTKKIIKTLQTHLKL